MGKLISKDARAYSYLPESVQAFPHGEQFMNIMAGCGLKKGRRIPLTFGIASIYEGIK